MSRSLFLCFSFFAFFSVIVSASGVLRAAPKVGDTYKITLTKETSQKSALSSGGSQDSKTIIERVIEVRADGLELEYDLPDTTKDTARQRQWQFPIRVLKPLKGPPQLLNDSELETRVDLWLKTFNLPREACGKTIFTWNAFRIECDPQSVIKTIESFDLGVPYLQEGEPYYDVAATGIGKLTKKNVESDEVSFATELPVDPDAVRLKRAEADVILGEMRNKPLTIEMALQRRLKEIVSGTISVVFEGDSTGKAYRRTKTTTVDIKLDNSTSERTTTTEILERQLIPTP